MFARITQKPKKNNETIAGACGKCQYTAKHVGFAPPRLQQNDTIKSIGAEKTGKKEKKIKDPPKHLKRDTSFQRWRWNDPSKQLFVHRIVQH